MAPFNETVQQVFARISALRDALDGPQTDDQGVPTSFKVYIIAPIRMHNPALLSG